MTTKSSLLRQLALASFAISLMVVGCTTITDAALATEQLKDTQNEHTQHP